MKTDVDAVRRAYLDVPDEAVFLERARILRDSRERYADLSPGLRQGRIIEDLCDRITVVVEPSDVFLGRVFEEVPSPSDRGFVDRHPEFFISPGVPGWLDSASIYIPNWEKLLRLGISGLIEEVGQYGRRDVQEDYLSGVRLSLQAISRLIGRYANAARGLAERTRDPVAKARLLEAGVCCEGVAVDPPETFREALQLFALFHMVLSCLIGGRNVTPGRMDQYLFPFYDRDIACGRIAKEDAVELLAVAMIMFSQMSGTIATDFQSRKRSPNRYSHCYVTLAGVGADGRSAVNELSFAVLEARRLVNYREPSLVIRYTRDIDRSFWNDVVTLMRDRTPVLVYNDQAAISGLMRSGLSEKRARDYAHCACLNCAIPGHATCMRDNHNLPHYILLALNGGRDPMSEEQIGPRTPEPEALRTFDDLFEALRGHVRVAMEQSARRYADVPTRFPLPVWPLFEGHLEAGYRYGEQLLRYVDEHLVGLATAVDSLLAVRQVVYREKRISLHELVGVLRTDFSGHTSLREYLRHRVPSYGSGDPEALEMTDRVGGLWVEEVDRASSESNRVRLRPGFHSWLYNMQMGEWTGATPNGRLGGESLSSDLLPSSGHTGPPTEVLRCMARLPHDCTCSGGTTLRLGASHFSGEDGIHLLSSLVETYFASGGLQLHFVFADRSVLQDAIEHPEKHGDLLVRVTGFSEYFVRLLPEVQREIIRRG